jgi:LCP family protein required for cell wall assembly
MKRKFLASFLIALVIFSLMYGWVWSKLIGNVSALQKIEEESGVDKVDNIVEGNEIKQQDLDEVLFLLVGVDINDVTKIKVGKNGGTGYRSDTMMICKVNFKDGSIRILSMPRDSKVPINGKLDKLGHAHSYGGMKLLMKTMREVTNLDLDYYVRVDYSSVREIVDAIGGVEIDVPVRMYKVDTTKGKEYKIDLQPGVQVLDGNGAMSFLRFRSYKTGDVERTKMQQYFLTELIKQVIQPKNVLKLPKLLDVYSKHIDTNMDPSIIYSGLSLAGNLDGDNIVTSTLPGEGYTDESDGLSYFRIYKNDAKAVIEDYFGNYLMD